MKEEGDFMRAILRIFTLLTLLYAFAAVAADLPPELLVVDGAKDIETVYADLKAKIGPKTKYEKAADYQQRITAAVSADTVYAFVLDENSKMRMTYEPEEERFRSEFSAGFASGYTPEKVTDCKSVDIKYRQNSEEMLEGQTAMGATFTFRSTTGEKWELLVRNTDRVIKRADGRSALGASFFLDVPPASAEAFEKNLGIMYLAKLATDRDGSIVLEGSFYRAATTKWPYEHRSKQYALVADLVGVVFFDKQTKQVIRSVAF